MLKKIAKLEKMVEKAEFNKRIKDWEYEKLQLELEDLLKLKNQLLGGN